MPYFVLMRHFGILLFLFVFASSAQIPQGYYDVAEGKTKEELKAALNDIIKGHTEFPYTSSSTDTWDILKETDRDPANNANVIGIYSGFSMNGALEYDNAKGWSREHVWAKSRGDFGTDRGAGTDVHHLRAEDVSTNSARSNRNFNNDCDTQYVDGDGTTNSYSCSNEFSWEPPTEVKGDIARMLFYMATRYEGENGEPDLELTEVLQSNTSKAPLHAKLSVLLVWHEEDPVNETERSRNDIIYGYQKNRNPFIDHPEYVDLIWGEEEEPEPEPVLGFDEESFSIFPNPVIRQFQINSSIRKPLKIYLYDNQGRLVKTFKGKSTPYRVQNIEAGLYNVIIELEDKVINQKLIIEK